MLRRLFLVIAAPIALLWLIVSWFVFLIGTIPVWVITGVLYVFKLPTPIGWYMETGITICFTPVIWIGEQFI